MKFQVFLIAFITTLLALAASAFAQVPVAPTVTHLTTMPNPTVGDVLVGIFSLVKSWGSLGLYAGIATALKLIVDGTKALGIFDKIPAQLQALFVMLIGFVTVGLTTLASGGSFLAALSAALGSSAGAMLLHEVWQDFSDWLAEKAEPTQTPPAAS